MKLGDYQPPIFGESQGKFRSELYNVEKRTFVHSSRKQESNEPRSQMVDY